MKRTVLIVLLILVLAACATRGHKFDPAAVDQLRPGVSTATDAVAALGKPTSASAMANGATLLQWLYVQGGVAGKSAAHVAILFDAQGRMVRVTHRFQE